MPPLMRFYEAIRMEPSAFCIFKSAVFDVTNKYSSSRALIIQGMYEGKKLAFKFFVSSTANLSKRYEKLKEVDFDFIPKYSFYENEVNIIDRGRFAPQPLLVSEWIEGSCLSDKLIEYCHNDDNRSISDMLGKVLDLFIKLLSNDIVHGDLKFDNILMDNNGKLHLLDWDGFYMPDLKDYPSCEIGTTNFQHPKREPSHYGMRLDDYSMAIIVLTLIVFREQPSLLGRMKDDIIILIPTDIIDGKSRIYMSMCEAWKYYPMRRELLHFVAGDNLELPALRDILIRLSGKAKFNPKEEEIIDYTAAVRTIINKRTKLFGFIDSDDNVIIDTMYGDCTHFINGIAGVRINNSWFFIDMQGEQVSDLFQKINEGSNGVFYVKRDGEWFCYK